jgi:hypothetical protein
VSECANLHGARLPPPKLQECCNSYTPRTRRIRSAEKLEVRLKIEEKHGDQIKQQPSPEDYDQEAPRSP